MQNSCCQRIPQLDQEEWGRPSFHGQDDELGWETDRWHRWVRLGPLTYPSNNT